MSQKEKKLRELEDILNIYCDMQEDYLMAGEEVPETLTRKIKEVNNKFLILIRS